MKKYSFTLFKNSGCHQWTRTSDYHSQDNKESEAKTGRSQDALLKYITQGGTTDTRYMVTTPRVSPLFCLWDLASALDAAPQSQNWRLYCIRMEVRLEGHAIGPPPAYSWNDAVVADVVFQIIPKLYEVCVMGPSSAYLFFRRQTINEGPERDEAPQIGNLLMGPIQHVVQ